MNRDDFKGIKINECFGKVNWEFPTELNYILHFTSK